MKNMPPNPSDDHQPDELLSEYAFDYAKSRPNRFAAHAPQGSRWVRLDADVAASFKTPEAVNQILRALIEHMPSGTK